MRVEVVWVVKNETAGLALGRGKGGGNGGRGRLLLPSFKVE